MSQTFKFKVLQINTNRSRPVQDLALTKAVELGAAVIAVSEPNKNSIRLRKDLIKDEKLDVGIKVLDSKVPIKSIRQKSGYVSIELNSLTIYSCYRSGNEDLTRMLDEISDQIRTIQNGTVVTVDINAKSP
ncbi:hypothetical protein QE152_g11042 [Popillia japonica]|uniref:Uncharacterized protein n=1 Tax=Popillia japonica TaxID=7064 RepID=A0AAW1LUL2_POPJA